MMKSTFVASRERRSAPRHVTGFEITLRWHTKAGEQIASHGATENIGRDGLLVHLPQDLPPVGAVVTLSIVPEPFAPVSAVAEVIRLVRNVGRPQAALQLRNNFEQWEVEVYEYAAEYAQRLADRENEVWR